MAEHTPLNWLNMVTESNGAIIRNASALSSVPANVAREVEELIAAKNAAVDNLCGISSKLSGDQLKMNGFFSRISQCSVSAKGQLGDLFETPPSA